MSGSYRVVDPLNRLRLRVRLRLIQDVRLAARDNNKDSDHDATGRVYTYELRWQERVAGPRHALGEHLGGLAQESRSVTHQEASMTCAVDAAEARPVRVQSGGGH